MGIEDQDKRIRDLLDECLSQHFGVQDEGFHRFIEDNADYLDLTSGDVLIRQGDTSNAVYFLLSGHLRAILDAPNGTSTALGEIGRGETVGELALFTGKPRGANVVATRDSIVAKIEASILEEAIGKKPQVAFKITRQIIDRYERNQALTPPPAASVNITVLPITPNVDLDSFTAKLVELRKRKGRNTLVIDSHYVDSELGGLDKPDVVLPRGRVSLSLSDLELKHSGLIFVANPSERSWCETAVHHSDEVILVADAKKNPDVSQIEKELLEGREHLRAQTTLVLLHKDDQKSPMHTSKWLDVRHVTRHVHVRKNNKLDYARLNRILLGQATGLVLAGGGARGMAHLGVMSALGEAGLHFDFIGGTSAGAIMGSFLAMDVKPKDLEGATRDVFLNSPFGNISGDYNLVPMLSILKGQRAWSVSRKAVMDNAGADIDMEDSWINFFVIASNFTSHEERVLKRGNLARNVMASFAIPGLMPPILIDGELMFDGGSFNNFPVDHMRQQGARHIVGVDLLSDYKIQHELDEIPSSPSVLWDKLKKSKKRRYGRLPSLPATLLTATVVTSIARQKMLRDHVDILFQPNTRGVGLLDWDKYDLLFQRSKEDALRQLESLDAEVLQKYNE